MLSKMCCPQLEILTLHQEELPDSEGGSGSMMKFSVVRSFFTSCSKTLKKLDVKDLMLGEHDFLHLLGLLMQLKTLVVQGSSADSCFTIDVSKRLFGYGQGVSRRILPRLKNLSIDLTLSSGLHFTHLAELVSSRCIPAQDFNAITCCVLERAAFALRDVELPREAYETWKAFAVDGIYINLNDSSGLVDLSTINPGLSSSSIHP